MRKLYGVVLLTACAFATSQDAPAASCEDAALNFYCTAVTTALGRATNDKALSEGLLTRSADYAKKADKSGHPKLRDKYYKQGVDAASQSTRPVTMKDLIDLCVDVKQAAVKSFLARAALECK